MIEYFISNGRGEIKRIHEYINGCWVNLQSPSEEEINSIVEKFKLDKEMINQGLDIYEDPRFETKGKKIYMFLSTPTERVQHEDLSSFLVIFTKKELFTISKYPLEIFDKMIATKKIKDFTSSRNLLRILFYVSKSFENSVHKIMKEVKVNKADLNKLRDKDIAKLINYENTLNSYITPFGEIIHSYSSILKTNLISIQDNSEEKLEDWIIALNETLNLCKSTLKTITNMRSYYSTRISNDLNKTVTILTIFMIFLTVPTLVSSIYGMNINLPFQNSPNIFLILVLVVFVGWGLMMFFLRILRLT